MKTGEGASREWQVDVDVVDVGAWGPICAMHLGSRLINN